MAIAAEERGRGIPLTEREQAARHFNISPSEVTPEMIQALPTKGTGLELGTARGISEEAAKEIGKIVADEVISRVYGVPELAFHVAEHEATGHGIVVDRALAEATPCKCFTYDTDEYAWSPGVVGLISKRKTPEDFEKFCAVGKEPASPGAAERFRKLKGAIGEAQERYEREGGGLSGWWEQVGKTLGEKGIELSSSKASPEVATSKEKMPRVDPHATAIQQDKQLVEQMKWLKAHGFKTPREAQEAGY